MKTIITLLLTFIFFTSYSQTYAVVSVGKSDLNYIGEINVGYQFKGFVLEGNLLPHLDRVNAAYLGGSVGYNVPFGMFTLTPLFGRNYRLISTDKIDLNGWVYSAGLRMEYKSVTLCYTRMDEINFVTVGFRGLLTKNYSR